MLHGCTEEGTPIFELVTPRLVSQSQPDSMAETGIGQDPNTGGMFLQWYSTHGAAGYMVYRTDSTDMKGLPVDFLNVGNLASSLSPVDTSMVDVSVQAGVKYYYCVKAYAPDGSLSKPSDTADYIILPRPAPMFPTPGETVPDSAIYFNWKDNTGGGYTVVRVKDITPTPSALVWVSKRIPLFPAYPAVGFNFDSTATGRVVSGHYYQWRVDRFDVDGNGRPFEGSRSPWWTFTVQ